MYGLTKNVLTRPLCRSALSSMMVSRWTPVTTAWSRSKSSTPSTPSQPQGEPPSPSFAFTNLTHLSPQSLSRLPTEREFASQILHGRSALPPYYHPRTHNVPVALVHFRSHHVPLLNLFIHFASHAAGALGIPITRPASLPTQRRLWTVIKGPFVHKKAQENFERRTHKRVVKVYDSDQEVVDRWVKYLEHHALAGVGIRVVRWHRAPLGIGEKTMEAVKGQLRLGDHLEEGVTHKEKIQKLSEGIVQAEMQAQKVGGGSEVQTGEGSAKKKQKGAPKS